MSTTGTTITQNCTYLQNPGFPTGYTTATSVTYTIAKCDNSDCIFFVLAFNLIQHILSCSCLFSTTGLRHVHPARHWGHHGTERRRVPRLICGHCNLNDDNLFARMLNFRPFVNYFSRAPGSRILRYAARTRDSTVSLPSPRASLQAHYVPKSLSQFSYVVYIDIGTVSSDTATLTFNFLGTDTTTGRLWEIKVSQVPCFSNSA